MQRYYFFCNHVPFGNNFGLVSVLPPHRVCRLRPFNAKFDVKLNESDKTMSLVAELSKGNLLFYFPMDFPTESPITWFFDKYGKKKRYVGTWTYNGDISNSFKNYISTLQ